MTKVQKHAQQEPPPPCTGKKNEPHAWKPLGVEDNGEIVERCSRCKCKRYTAKGGKVRYEEYQAPTKGAKR